MLCSYKIRKITNGILNCLNLWPIITTLEGNRLSRAPMVTEGAYGWLKGRWRILSRRSDCSPEAVKLMSLTCAVMHNICIDLEDTASITWDLSFSSEHSNRRPRQVVRDL